jgi:hypothetical protein
MKRNNVYTFQGCTIEVAPGGQWAKATRHPDGRPPESREFRVLGVPDAPSPQVQAQRWVMGILEEPKPVVAKPKGSK